MGNSQALVLKKKNKGVGTGDCWRRSKVGQSDNGKRRNHRQKAGGNVLVVRPSSCSSMTCSLTTTTRSDKSFYSMDRKGDPLLSCHSSRASTFNESSFLMGEEDALLEEEEEEDDDEEEEEEEDTSAKEASHVYEIPPTTKSSWRLHSNTNEELGGIRYQFFASSCVSEECKEQSRKTRRPILAVLLHEEKRGCDSAQECLREVLSHPLIVEAADSLFVTLAATNEGKRPAVAEQDELIQSGQCRRRESKSTIDGHKTSVQIVDGESGEDIIKTIPGAELSVGGLAAAMIDALDKYGTPIPNYLRILAEEEAPRSWPGSSSACRRDREAFFAMPCSCVGEVEFAGLDGVIATKTGWLNHSKVVKVTYDSERLYYGSLVRYALQKEVADAIYYQTNDEKVAALVEVNHSRTRSQVIKLDGSILPDHNHASKHALRQTVLRYVPLTGLQSMRANQYVYNGAFNEAIRILSPRQNMIVLMALQSSQESILKDVVDVPIGCAWQTISDLYT